MNVPTEKNPVNQNPETDPIFTEAIANFRASVHTWSQDLLDRELAGRPASARATQPSRWRWLMAPAVSWAAAAALTIAAVGVPFGIHYRNAAQQHLATQSGNTEQAGAQSLTPPAQAPGKAVAENKTDDDQLLQHVDTDIAQDTPDAMQPLASLMSTSGND